MKHNVIAIAAAITAAALAAGAATLEVQPLPEPATADREVSATHALPAAGPDGPRVFRLELVFEATPSNHVQVCLGRDTAPADGVLDAGETDLAIGWDRGGWFLSPRGLCARHAVPAASSNGTQRLTALIRVTAAGACLPPAFTDRDGAVAFAGLPQPPLPEWLHPGTWDTLRVTARGADAPQERITIMSAPDATRITIK